MIAEVCAVLLNIAPVLSNEVAFIRVPEGTVLVETDGVLPTGWIYWSPGLDQAPVRMNMPPWLYTGAVTATTVTADSLRSDVLWLGTGGGYVSNSPPGAIEIGGKTTLRLDEMKLDVTYGDGSLLVQDEVEIAGYQVSIDSVQDGIAINGTNGGVIIRGAVTFTDQAYVEDSDIGVTVQAYDADLDDLADGSLSGSKVGTGIAAGNITSGTIPTTVLPWAGTYAGQTATRGTAWVNDRLTFGGLVLDSGQLTPGSGAYGVGLEWTTISTDATLRKKASIVPRQYGADVDQLGLDVFASGTTGAGDLMQLAIRIQGSSVYFPGSVTFSNGLSIAGGTLTGDSTLTRDTEWDTAAEINAATTDEDFITESALTNLTVGALTADTITLLETLDGLDAMTLSVSNLAAQVVSGPTNYTADADTGMTIAGDLILSIQGDIIADAALLPDANNTIDIGASGTRWRTIYAATGNITDVQAVGVTADEFVGGASGLTDVPAAELTGTIPVAVRHPAYKEVISSSHTLTASECYNGAKYWVTAAATLTLPPVAEDMEIIVIADGANAVSVDANAADRIKLDGTALDDGDKITSDGTAGAVVVLSYRDADGWYATTDGLWSDGGP